MARDIVRTKSQINKIEQFQCHLKALSLKVGTVSSINELTTALEEAGKAITLVSGHLDAGKLSELSRGLAKEYAKLDMKQEYLSEILDNMGESMDDPVEQEKLYKQVLDDIGLQVEEMVS